jgi:hypothetical protein
MLCEKMATTDMQTGREVKTKEEEDITKFGAPEQWLPKWEFSTVADVFCSQRLFFLRRVEEIRSS